MTNKRMSLAKRRQQILRAAIPLFAKSGFKGATTLKIAKAAGVKEPILYRAFGTKAKLIQECLTVSSERIIRSISSLVKQGSAAQLIQAYYKLYPKNQNEHLVLYHAMVKADDPVIRKIVRNLYRRHARQVNRILTPSCPNARKRRGAAWLFVAAGHFYNVRKRFQIHEAVALWEPLSSLIS